MLVCEGQTEPLVISSIDDVMNYSDPTTHGALLKAALVCAGVVQNSQQELSQQLEKVELIIQLVLLGRNDSFCSTIDLGQWVGIAWLVKITTRIWIGN